MISGDARNEFDQNSVAAYTALEDIKYDFPDSGQKAQAKINRLLKQKHAHVLKHGCSKE